MSSEPVHELKRSVVGPVDAGAVSVDDLDAALARLRRAEAELLAVLGPVDSLGLTDVADGLQTAQWVAREMSWSPRTAKQWVRDAKACRDRMPADVFDRIASGEISRDHVRVLDNLSNPRIEPDWADQAGPLLDAAGGATFAAWSRGVTGLAKGLDADGGYDPKSDPFASVLKFSRIPEGIRLSGILTGEPAEIVFQALEAETDRQFKRFVADEHDLGVECPSRATLQAFALAELVRLGRLGSPGRMGRAEADLIVRLSENENEAGCGCEVTAPDGTLLDRVAVGRLLCDSVMTGIILDAAGNPVAVGGRHRLASPQQRRLLAERDGGCCMRGCDRPAVWSDAHHVVWFENGGVTDLTNLALLCRHHHGVVHRTGWRMALTEDQWAVFQRPDGTRFWGQRHGRQRQGPIPEQYLQHPGEPGEPPDQLRLVS